MRILRYRLFMLLAAGLAAGAPAAAPGQTLRAFGSEKELSAFLRALSPPEIRQVPAPVAPPPQADPCGPAARAAVTPVDSGAAVVRGTVTNESGNPLPSVIVRIDSLCLIATTAADGRFRLVIPRERLAAPRSVDLTVLLLGYESGKRALTLTPGDSAVADFQLGVSVLRLEQLVAMAVGNESVTNVQHAGVDEGGIVKVHGDHLVILRRGRLFTVEIGDGALRPVSAVDAFGPGIDPDGAWYDEMLVDDGVVVVIGFSYERGGTELGLFDLDGAGALRHRATYHLRSDDYYSAHNYASRLIDGKLVFYTPLYLPLGGTKPSEWLPALRKWRPGAEGGEFRPVVSATRIYRPAREVSEDDDLALHTVTVCDLGGAELECEATALVGPFGRVFYVSPGSVYVWVSDWEVEPGQGRAPGMVYRLPLDGSAPSALGVAGSPVDQFSFLESEDGHLNVLVRSEARGDWMWSSEQAEGDVALLRVPLARFGDGSGDVPASGYRLLPAPDGGEFQNRFVGDYLLYGVGSGWRPPENRDGLPLYAVPWRGGRVSGLALPHSVDRIEAMGADAVVVGADERNLHFSAVRLGWRPMVRDRYVLADASQGETRSHGFFYKPEGERTGMLGLPVRGPGRPGWEHLFDESASILFLRNERLRFQRLGELEADPERSADDACRASCVDWYGNARPLFLRDRIFALLGYELVEGGLDGGGRLRELRRVSYAPRGTVAAGN